MQLRTNLKKVFNIVVYSIAGITALNFVSSPTQPVITYQQAVTSTTTPSPSPTPKTTTSSTIKTTPTPVETTIPTYTLKPTPKPTYKPTPTSRPVITTPYTCNCSKTCTQIVSCAEAYYQLNTCGCSVRDGDNDGVPCESLCR